MSERLAWALRYGVMGGCAWELVALTTRRVPTITAVVCAVPLRARCALWGAVVAVGTDHFLTRRWI